MGETQGYGTSNMITTLHHIAIIVSSEESLQFYKLLGFKEIFRKVRENDAVVLLSGYGLELEVFIDPRHPKHQTELNEPIGLRHFALCVSGLLEQETERLKEAFSAAGYELEISPIMEDWTGTRFCFIKDFDGLSIELREQERKEI